MGGLFSTSNWKEPEKESCAQLESAPESSSTKPENNIELVQPDNTETSENTGKNANAEAEKPEGADEAAEAEKPEGADEAAEAEKPEGAEAETHEGAKAVINALKEKANEEEVPEGESSVVVKEEPASVQSPTPAEVEVKKEKPEGDEAAETKPIVAVETESVKNEEPSIASPISALPAPVAPIKNHDVHKQKKNIIASDENPTPLKGGATKHRRTYKKRKNVPQKQTRKA